MKYADCWAGGLIGVIGIVAICAAWPLQLVSDFGPGPGFVPVLLGIGLIVMGAGVAIAAWRGRDNPKKSYGSFRKPLLVAAVMAGYLALLNVLGFPVATALFLFTLIHWVESRSVSQALALAVFITLGLHIVFVAVLKTSLPVGILPWIS
jgi:putative tricarboxylic transport membrane protein